jgi:hypothetical protein
MTNYEIIHTITNIDVSKYNYFAVLIDGTGTIKGESITTTGPVILPISIRVASEVSGDGIKAVFGIKKPEITKTTNSDGTWSIK